MLLKENLQMAKRAVVKLPDQAREIAGYCTRSFRRSPWEAEVVGKVNPSQSRPYASEHPSFDVRIVTPSDGHYMSTFFDVTPFSPSGRFLAVTRVPFINHIPAPSDKALVCVIDLLTNECRNVYETQGWGAQLGANVQWGANDHTLFCNDFIDDQVKGIRIDLQTGAPTQLDGPIYGTDPLSEYSYSADLKLVNALLPGYGVPENPFKRYRQKDRASTTNGLWRTNLVSGKTELLASVKDIVSQIGNPSGLSKGTHYLFNIKVDPTNQRLLIVVFTKDIPGRIGPALQLVTTNLMGRDARLVVPDEMWRKGGHHPNWLSDGSGILMNLKLNGRMCFVVVPNDDREIQPIALPALGGGHPTMHPDGRNILTDAYVSEGFRDRHNNVPLRWVDATSGTETQICKIFTNNLAGARRIDPHPAWNRDFDAIAFNGLVAGNRQVMVANIKKKNQ